LAVNPITCHTSANPPNVIGERINEVH